MDEPADTPVVKHRDAPIQTGEHEIFRTNLVGGRTARVLFRGPTPTQAQIAKLIALLELSKDQYPVTDTGEVQDSVTP